MAPGDNNIIDLAGERRRRGPRFDGGLMEILEVSRDLVCLCRAGAITAINGAGARMLGAATTEELVGRRMTEFLVPEYGRMLEMFLGGMVSEDKAVPTRIMALDKTVKDVEMQTFRAREIAADATVVVCRHLTEEMEAVHRLHESDLRFRLAADHSMNGLWHVKDGVVRYCNKAAVALLSADGPQALVGAALTDMLDGDPLDADGLRALAETGLPLRMVLVGKGGARIPVTAQFTLLPSPSGLEVMMEARG
jgi:PAS domain-containing protein